MSETARKAAANVRSRAGVPSTPPKTSFELEKTRRTLSNDLAAWGQYLLMIKPKTLPKLLKNSLSEEMLTSIIQGIAAHFIPAHSAEAVALLKHLARADRFDTVLMFLDGAQKETLQTIFTSLESSSVSQKVTARVRKLYKV